MTALAEEVDDHLELGGVVPEVVRRRAGSAMWNDATWRCGTAAATWTALTGAPGSSRSVTTSASTSTAATTGAAPSTDVAASVKARYSSSSSSAVGCSRRRSVVTAYAVNGGGSSEPPSPSRRSPVDVTGR